MALLGGGQSSQTISNSARRSAFAKLYITTLPVLVVQLFFHDIAVVDKFVDTKALDPFYFTLS